MRSTEKEGSVSISGGGGDIEIGITDRDLDPVFTKLESGSGHNIKTKIFSKI